MTVLLRAADGGLRELALDDWHAPATAAELELLADLPDPVLDLGCGPGRLVAALASRGVPAMGVDASPLAVRWAAARGAPALCHSVFDALPGEGRWAAVLLLDGNVGIGGDPAALFRRIRELLAPNGVAVVEVGPPGTPSAMVSARLERGEEHTPWFPWAFVSVGDVDEVVAGAGLHVENRVSFGDRWFVRLSKTATR